MTIRLAPFNTLTLNDRILLYLSAAGASCALYRHATLNEVSSLPGDEEGWEAFNALLIKHPNKPVAIAVDTVDEIYRQDILPRAHGTDRREMTDRRLRQLIHHSAYRAALKQQPVSGPGRQDRYLMMGLTNTEIIRPWLDILHVRGAHLAGIWLLPALAIPLAKKFQLNQNRLLLVSEQTGGLRLTYLEDGELRFSRLAPVDSSQFDNPLESYADEIERTRQSLVGQRLLARSEPLRTLLLDPLNTLTQLHAFLPESAGFQCESILRSELLETLKLPPTLLAESSDALYLKLLPDAPRSTNLMTREQHAITRLHWMKRGLVFVAASWLGLSLLASGLLLLDAWRIERAADAAHASTRQNRSEEAAILSGGGGSATLEKRMKVVQSWQNIDALDHDPGPLFQRILDLASPIDNLHVQRIEWLSGNTTVLRLEGEISPFNNDFRAAHQRVQKLVDQLEGCLTMRIDRNIPTATENKAPAHQTSAERSCTQKQHLHIVRVKRWPLNVSESSALEGEFGHNQASAAFQIEITQPAQ